jgi:predicted ArsR family transcriptional regulator
MYNFSEFDEMVIAMQQTRRHILEILRERGEATVDDLVSELKDRIQHEITPVTVRHHLDIMRGEDLVTPPTVRRRSTRGRPQYVYTLTDKARQHFPNNYENLATSLLEQIKSRLPATEVNVILEGVADDMIANAAKLGEPAENLSIEERLDQTVQYLTNSGYDASWESSDDGYILRTQNCPYHQIVGEHTELCAMDLRLIAGLLGVVPRIMGRIADEESSCAYLIPQERYQQQ